MDKMCEKNEKYAHKSPRWVDGSACALTMTMMRTTTVTTAPDTTATTTALTLTTAPAATIIGVGFCLGVDVQQFPLLGHGGVTCAKKVNYEKASRFGQK